MLQGSGNASGKHLPISTRNLGSSFIFTWWSSATLPVKKVTFLSNFICDVNISFKIHQIFQLYEVFLVSNGVYFHHHIHLPVLFSVLGSSNCEKKLKVLEISNISVVFHEHIQRIQLRKSAHLKEWELTTFVIFSFWV